MMSRHTLAELNALSYRDLQLLAKDAGLRSSGKSEELIQRILQAGTEGATPTTTAGEGSRSDAPSRTPRSSRKAGGAADKAAMLRAAASTPLPAGRPEGSKEREASEQEQPVQQQPEQTPRSTGVRQRRPQPVSAERLQPTPSAADARPRSSAPSSAGLLLLRLVLLTAAAAAFSAVAVPYCQQADCRALARDLPDAAAGKAAVAYSHMRSRVLSAADAAKDHWRDLASHGGHASNTSSSCQLRAVPMLAAILPEGEDWQGLLAAASAMLGSGGRKPAGKAAAALFVCEVEEDCETAAQELGAAAGGAGRCLLDLDGRELGADKGALQAQLALFLEGSPKGIVVLRRIDQLSPELLPVLISALSEQGAFQKDGVNVPTTGGTFLLTSHMPDEVFDDVRNDGKFKAAAKTHLVTDFTLRAANKDAAGMQAKALRRRIDFVLPIGSDPVEAENLASREQQLGPPTCLFNAAGLVNTLLPEGDDWLSLRTAAVAALGNQAEPTTQAATALFVCEVPEDCDSLAVVVEAAVATQACVMIVEGSHISNRRLLQNKLASFLLDQPTGIIVLNRLDLVSLDVLDVLVDALSKHGTLELQPAPTSDPADTPELVPTSGATFLLTSLLPNAFDNVGDEEPFKQDVHQQMLLGYGAAEGSGSPVVQALQDRIDFVLPVGSDPADIEAAAAMYGDAATAVDGEFGEEEVVADMIAAAVVGEEGGGEADSGFDIPALDDEEQ